MAKYRTEFKVKVVKEYLKSSISYKYLSEKYYTSDKGLTIRWVNDFRKQGIEGLKPKKRGRPSKMPKSTNKS
ncbi:MAG: helix-turn-helix domain-containing protein, partial [Finegoldia magna]|nr:helix-turn-helix domain-containing protein [Finegoldia magna]